MSRILSSESLIVTIRSEARTSGNSVAFDYQFPFAPFKRRIPKSIVLLDANIPYEHDLPFSIRNKFRIIDANDITRTGTVNFGEQALDNDPIQPIGGQLGAIVDSNSRVATFLNRTLQQLDISGNGTNPSLITADDWYPNGLAVDWLEVTANANNTYTFTTANGSPYDFSFDFRDTNGDSIAGMIGFPYNIVPNTVLTGGVGIDFKYVFNNPPS